MGDECNYSMIHGFKSKFEVTKMHSLHLKTLWFYVYLGGGFGSSCIVLMRCITLYWVNHSCCYSLSHPETSEDKEKSEPFPSNCLDEASATTLLRPFLYMISQS